VPSPSGDVIEALKKSFEEKRPGVVINSVADYSADVHRVRVDAREFIIVGTAHISQESADLVREVIERERPDCVCVELDAQRYAALSQKARWEALDLKQVIRDKQLAALFANLVLASYQKKLGGALGVLPGTELLEAAKAADALGIPISLCDRDVRVTLRRAWASMSFVKKFQLLSTLAVSIFESPEIGEEELRKLRDQDVLSELMRELGEAMPTLKRTLIDERDTFLTQNMKRAHGEKIVAVVGAGHVEGICRALPERRDVDLEEINLVPPVSAVWKWVGWGIPALIIGSLLFIGATKGAEVAGQNLLYWIVANGLPSTLGAILAFAHPITIAAAFFVAPVTSLTPVIGAGYVLAFLQAYVRPPVVKELEQLTDDIGVLRQWWRNRMLRIFLVFFLTTLGSLIGTYVGGYEIIKNLF
jgi:pheromone shutdown-related protein TraB